MQRPPQLPALLSSRQASQWINRVREKLNAWSGLKLSQEKQQSLKQWLEVEFIHATLLLEERPLGRELILQVIQAAPGLEASGELLLIGDVRDSFRKIEEVSQRQGAKARLSVELLLRLDANEEFRKSNSSASSVRAEHLPLIVENACRWFAMQSFAELNPVEQAAIALLRLVELAPFAQNNQRNALIAASLFTLRSQLPPIIFQLEQRRNYLAAVQQGLRMNTQPMVELVAAAVEQTLDGMTEVVAESR